MGLFKKNKSNQPSEITIVPVTPATPDLAPSQEMEKKNEVAEVIKELFKEDKISMISDLQDDEIKLIVRIKMISGMKKIQAWSDGADLLMKLYLSRNRKSRSEVLDAIRGLSAHKSFLQKLNPANWGK